MPNKITMPNIWLLYMLSLIRSWSVAETDSMDVERQAIRILSGLRNCIIAIRLVNTNRSGCPHAVGMQKDHDGADDFLFSPSVSDLLLPLRSNASQFGHAFWRLLEHLKDLLPKGSHQFLSEVGTDPLDHPGTQLFFDAFQRCRWDNAEIGGFELKAMSTIGDPPSFAFYVFAWCDGGCRAYHGFQVPVASDFDPQEPESCLLTMKSDALDGTSELFG